MWRELETKAGNSAHQILTLTNLFENNIENNHIVATIDNLFPRYSFYNFFFGQVEISEALKVREFRWDLGYIT